VGSRFVQILVLDDDLGFLFWFAEAMEPFGYHVVPADTVAQATRIMRRLKLAVDLLIVNPDLPGAVEFTASLQKRKDTHVKVVALISQENSHSEHHRIRADATRAKPDPGEIAEMRAAAELGGTQPRLQSEWARFVQQMLGHRTARSRAN